MRDTRENPFAQMRLRRRLRVRNREGIYLVRLTEFPDYPLPLWPPFSSAFPTPPAAPRGCLNLARGDQVKATSRDVLLRSRASQLVPRSLLLDLIEQPAHRVFQVFHRQCLRNAYRDERCLRWSILLGIR